MFMLDVAVEGYLNIKVHQSVTNQTKMNPSKTTLAKGCSLQTATLIVRFPSARLSELVPLRPPSVLKEPDMAARDTISRL